jgi:RNA polymerase sigma-70 factor (ECF subfamily)
MAPQGPLDLAEIARLHGAMLQRIALRLCGNPEIAKDLVQDTLLRAFQRSDQLKPGTNTAAWLVTILTNLFYDQLKHNKVEQKAVPALTVITDEAFETATMTTSDAALYAAVDALEDDLRKVVKLCYLQQVLYREAAELLNVPIGTIKSRLKRAREHLHELLTEAGETVKP